jgi:hypothetical protein
MEDNMKFTNKFSVSDMDALEPLEKIALYATVNPEGLPHITFVNSLMANTPFELTFGQFIRGESKWFMQNNSKVGFFILSPQKKRMWMGNALWREKKEDGAELDNYKSMPMQRYNSYFPIGSVHYLDLVKTTAPLKIPVLSILKSILLTRFAKGKASENDKKRVLNPYSENLFNKIAAMKFLSFIDSDGFPRLLPVFEAQAAGSNRVVFNPGPFKNELDKIPDGAEVAVFALSLKLESVLVRGKFKGFERHKGIKLCFVDLSWVYNSMPPNAGQIYPETSLEAVTDF